MTEERRVEIPLRDGVFYIPGAGHGNPVVCDEAWIIERFGFEWVERRWFARSGDSPERLIFVDTQPNQGGWTP